MPDHHHHQQQQQQKPDYTHCRAHASPMSLQLTLSFASCTHPALSNKRPTTLLDMGRHSGAAICARCVVFPQPTRICPIEFHEWKAQEEDDPGVQVHNIYTLRKAYRQKYKDVLQLSGVAIPNPGNKTLAM
ncbi:hypothetical protein V5799_025022 [Amblyomma americanum]|uniref:Uncharacterized protein n=1 Tax=Amblyomma americanum TaxID=6943 RepID=A0AAQ4EAD2_AMBAM